MRHQLELAKHYIQHVSGSAPVQVCDGLQQGTVQLTPEQGGAVHHFELRNNRSSALHWAAVFTPRVQEIDGFFSGEYFLSPGHGKEPWDHGLPNGVILVPDGLPCISGSPQIKNSL